MLLVRLLVPVANFELVTDKQNVWRTFNGGPKSGANSANRDFYDMKRHLNLQCAGCPLIYAKN